jgi:hypothetical protein
MTKARRTFYTVGSIAGAVALVWLVIGTITTVDTGTISAQAAGKERIGWAIIKKLDVKKGGATFDSDITTSGDVSAVNVTASGDLTVSGTAIMSATDTTGDVVITGTLGVVGASDAIQFSITGYTTQTNNVFTIQQSDGTDVITGSNAGALTAVDLLAADDVTAGDDVVVGDQLTVGGLTLPSATTTVITDGDTITATVTTHAMTNTVASTITLAAAGTNGQEVRLVALTTNEITIADANIRTPGGGTITMTQYYVIGLVSWGNEWLMQYRSTNQ